MRKLLLTITTIALMASCKNAADEQRPAIDRANFDESVALNEDFYQYATGGWQKANPMKPEFSRYGVFDILRENNEVRLNDLFASDFDYEATKKYTVAHNNEEIVELVDKLIDMCDGETKAALLVFCLCFAAVDHNVSCQETAYLIKLFA
jgi:predicted metalloendopeptidase